MQNDNDLYNSEYFKNRLENDPKRLKSFQSEGAWMSKFVQDGNVLDIGCSTGEFLKHIYWNGNKYGMEVSDYAKKLAISNGVNFDKDIFNSTNYYDAIIFRGTIQHIDTPFLYLKQTFSALKKNGYVFFFATPNTHSLYYKIWNTLPFLDPKLNYWLPSDAELINVMKNYGFTLVEKRYPYLKSAYSKPFKDHLYFILKLFGAKVKFAFWKNSMELCFVKE